MAEQENPGAAIQAAPQHHKPLLMELMASQYGMEPGKFKDVLLKTIFPQNQVATMEQLAMFCIVAHKYELNPLTREIYAFPSKGGGIVPVVGVDGWISLVQRQANYNGHKFVYEWADGKVGGTLLAATCMIARKDLGAPIEHTEFMLECIRDTDPWKKWPRRMLTHKSFIQCARYAFGLGGVYDQDEAERIIESEITIIPEKSPIQMPKRQEAITAGTQPLPQTAATGEAKPPETVIEKQTLPVSSHAEVVVEHPQTAPAQAKAEPGPAKASETTPEPPEAAGEPVPEPPAAFVGENLFDGPVPPTESKEKTIGPGQASRLKAIVGSKKVRSKQDLEDFKKAFGLEHLKDLPSKYLNDAERWAAGAEDTRWDKPISTDEE
jgi:phage recombination protein Bet